MLLPKLMVDSGKEHSPIAVVAVNRRHATPRNTELKFVLCSCQWQVSQVGMRILAAMALQGKVVPAVYLVVVTFCHMLGCCNESKCGHNCIGIGGSIGIKRIRAAVSP